MGTYRKEWNCCGSVTETECWEPESCPFCTDNSQPAASAGQSIGDERGFLDVLAEYNKAMRLRTGYTRALNELIAYIDNRAADQQPVTPSGALADNDGGVA